MCGIIAIIIRKWSHQANFIFTFPFHGNIFKKGMNPSLLLPSIGKIVEPTQFFCLVRITSLGEGKF